MVRSSLGIAFSAATSARISVAQLFCLRVQIDVDPAHSGARRDVDHLLRVLAGAAEAGGEHEGAAVVDVGVVLPREADAAVHLDAVLCGVLRRTGRQGGGNGRRELESGFIRGVLAVFIDGPGGVPHRGGGALGVGDHLGALVLDGLELTDRPAELLADLGVRRGGVRGPARDADAFRGQQRGDQRTRVRTAQVAQHEVVADLDGVGAHIGQRPQRIHAFDRLDFQRLGVENHPFLAAVDRHRQYQHRRLPGCGNGAHLASDDQAVSVPGGGQPGVEGVGRDHLAGGQVVEQLGVGVVSGDERTGYRRGDERAGNRAVAELGNDNRQLENAEPLSANGFRQMHTLQALFGGGVPVRRRVRNRGFQRLVQHVRRRDSRHQGPDGIGQVVVLSRDRDGHSCTSMWRGCP